MGFLRRTFRSSVRRDVLVPTGAYVLGLCKAWCHFPSLLKKSRTFASVFGFTRSPLAISMMVLLMYCLDHIMR
jgi:hypothetical protein